jgi:hypothetical protein
MSLLTASTHCYFSKLNRIVTFLQLQEQDSKKIGPGCRIILKIHNQIISVDVLY